MSNKSGIADNIINLPEGGGAQKGMGETFSPDLFSGTGNFSFPIAVQPGRNGLQPALTVGYSSGNGNSEWGLGWGLSIPGVMRKTNRGIPIYDDQKDTFILSGAEDLVPIDYSKELIEGVWHFATKYRPRTEGLFARITHHKTNQGIDYWEVRSKDGLISYYGNPDATNPDDDANTVIAHPERRDDIFAWKLYKTVDVFGNDIIYQYTRDLQETEQHHYDQLYLNRIDYTNYKDGGTTRYLCSVQFEYEERPDPFSTHLAGFEIRTEKRIKHVRTYTHPKDADRPAAYSSSGETFIDILVKRYDFFFTDERVNTGDLDAYFLPKNNTSILSQVQVCGFDHNTEPEKLPPLEFRYSTFNPVGKEFTPVKGKNLPPVSLANPEYEVADLNGNGLPDIVQINGQVARYWRNNGDGSFDQPRNMKEAPAGISLAQAGVTLADADGDGRVDLMVNQAGIAGYFTLNPNGEWDRKSLTKYEVAPSFSFADPEVQLMDLNGDGITDVLRNGSRFEMFYHDREEGWTDLQTVNKERLEGFPNVSFADPRVRIAGMSGGGLQDIALIHSGNISYWPNQGYGNWGKRVFMRNSPRLPYNFNPARIMLADFDGDGLTDLAYIEDNKVTLWVNQSGNAWSDPIEILGTPRVTDMDAVRAIDLKGNGVPGILWSYDAGAGTRERMYYLDLTGGVKPYLLNEMVNNMGALTRVQYRSSVQDYLRDETHLTSLCKGGTSPSLVREGWDGSNMASPWKTTLPMPVLVVEKTEVHDLISHSKLVTEYAYHHGYWDGLEREFRGFGRVDQKDTETFNEFNKQSLFKGNNNGWHANEIPDTKKLLANPNSGVKRTDQLAHNQVEKLHYTPPMMTRTWFHQGPVESTAILDKEIATNIGKACSNSDWTELDHSQEYFQEKWDGTTARPITISRPKAMVDLLKSLPRRARRDAYRTLRGAVLRTELYALDGTRFQHKPYTVTEANYGVRQEFEPSEFSFPTSPTSLSQGRTALSPVGGNTKGANSGYIFMSFSVGQRTTQWERGNDPMTSFAFSDDYDEYGIPHKQTAIAIPRYRQFLHTDASPPKGYAATLGITELIHKDTETHYLIGRASQAKSYEVVNNGEDDVFSLRDKIFSEDASLTFNLLGHSLNYYDGEDGDEYVGLPFGQIGDYGVPVRSESLIATSSIWTDAYGSIPDVLQDKTSLPGTYPTEFKNLLPDKGGYQYKTGGNYETGYYVEGSKVKYDFHDDSETTYGRSMAMRDALDHEATVTFDDYDLLPKTVTDPVGMQTEAWYDYRLFTPYKAKDPNDNFAEFAFNRLGLLYKSAAKAKYDVDDGSSDTADRIADDLDHPAAILEYDFFNFMDNGDPIWVKTTQRQYHYYGPTPEFGDKEDTIISCAYSDGFGRVLQSRSQAEEIVYGNDKFGDSGLPAAQNANGHCVGIENTDSENPNVIVNGWTVYNNKGLPVEQYEPYFDKGFDYKSSLANQLTSQALWQLVKDYVDINGESELTDEAALAAYLNTALDRDLDEQNWMRLLKDQRIVLDELSFNDDYAEFDNNAQYSIGTGDFSVEFWAWMDTNIDPGDTFISNRKFDGTDTYSGGFQIRATSTNKLQFLVADGNSTWANGQANVEVDLPSKEAWHHIVWTRQGTDESNWTCYVDGVEKTIVAVHNNLDDGDISDCLELKIGSNLGGHPSTPGHFEGIMKEVRLYGRAITAEEVSQSYNNGKGACPSNTTDLLLWAPLNEGSGDSILDKSPYTETGEMQLSAHTWARSFNDDIEAICADNKALQAALGLGQKSRIFYDPRGQQVRSISPDNTEARVIIGTPHDLEKPPVLSGPILNKAQDGNRDNYTPSPWISYAFDPNDLGAQYVSPVIASGAKQSLGIIAPDDSQHNYTSHYATPKITEVDELGRTIKTTEYQATADAEDVVMQYEYDIRGNVTRIIDAYNRDVFTHKYDLANQTLWTEHIDSGIKTVVYDLMGRPTEMKDAKGSHIINSYDELSRPIRMWAADNSGQSLSLRQINIFGDDSTYGPSSPKDTNHLGMPYKAYDEGGYVEIPDYHFSGAPLTKKQQVISDSTLLASFPSGTPYNLTPYTVDWVGLGSLPSILDATVYQTDSSGFDALGRPFITTLPADVNAVRKELKAEYNKAGAMSKVYFDGTEYIKEMAYNAKGQPIMTALGNGIMQRYAYSETNFRLLRTQSEKYSYTHTSNEHKYAYQSGTKVHNTAHQYDLAGNILKILERSTDCGIGALPNQLDRKFSYDPLNRLLSATGRESSSSVESDLWNNYSPPTGAVTASACQAYTRNYEYDKMGNIEKLIQTGTSGFTRNFKYNDSGSNILHAVKNADESTAHASFTYDVNGNRLTSGSARNYVWDYADQLKSFYNQTGTGQPSTYAQYIYSGGQRVKKLVRSTGGATETTVYIDGIMEFRSDSSANTQSVVHVGGVATIRTGYAFDGMASITYELCNHLGSSSYRLGSTGLVLDREEYYPFGDTSLRTWEKKRYRYVGKEKDQESGLYYYGARYYAAWTCRFISTDPLAWNYAQLNPYNYADNDPIGDFDVDGLQGKTTSTSGQNPSQTSTPSRSSGNESETKTYLTPAGLPFTIPARATPQFGTSTDLDIASGAMTGFTLDGHYYPGCYEKVDGEWTFLGYKATMAYDSTYSRYFGSKSPVYYNDPREYSAESNLEIYVGDENGQPTLAFGVGFLMFLTMDVQTAIANTAVEETASAVAGRTLIGRLALGATVVSVALLLTGDTRAERQYYGVGKVLAQPTSVTAPDPATLPRVDPDLPKGLDDDDRATVRFQFQTGSENIASSTKENIASVGVTKAQGYRALLELYTEASAKDPQWAKSAEFKSAIIRMSKKINSIQGGVGPGPYQTTLQENFTYNGLKYRIDLEVKRGINFRQ